ncbi:MULTISPECIES: hypothetical protein [Cyanophyceae]|uniref:hypothetical protein n=1 Tax=Cyanophyceae TaxID=3028117 RepID=UPI00232F0A26|nr:MULTISPECIES: hypothetical protein [Cyanophyceae]MDB9356942.1 hypothetical protein [Nodularia spumigena CS-587/03]MDB9339111.1 hypothetical protein [Nodularia spumigena CS-589/07]MDB9349595.1 hypothetical protein [Nodularia spumigena CS-588/01]MDB9353978.1 hypothetical protein [Nodularia spumigena CS-588/05]MDB9399397.1 hypothetical protein [Microcystis aeruginosa CS-567/02-A1]
MDPISLSIVAVVFVTTAAIQASKDEKIAISREEQITKRIFGVFLLVLSLFGLIYTINADEYQLIAGIITAFGTALGSVMVLKE